jgi:hypothetical protein
MKRRHNRPKSERTLEASVHTADGAYWWHSLAIVGVTAIGAAWFLIAEHGIAGTWGYSLDDSWIYATYAKNLAMGKGYVFNSGEHVAGATGPLYVFILALLYLLFHDVVIPAKILGILSLAGSALVVSRTMRRILPESPMASLIAGMLVALSPPLLWGSLSGLEIPVYLLLTCIGIYFYVTERWTLTVLCWSIGVWLRPDGLLLALLGLTLRPKVTLKNSVAPTAVFGLIVGAYFLFNEAVGGWLLPNSVRIAAHPGGNIFASQWIMVKQCADLWLGSIGGRPVAFHAVLLLPALVVGGVLALRRRPALVAYFVLFPMSLAVFRALAGQFARYVVPTVPFGIILGVVGFELASRRALGRRYVAGLLFLGIVCLGWQGYVARKVGIAHGWNVQNIEGMQHYIAEATRKATTAGDTVAVNDVGAMGYFSDCFVVDLVGLVSPRLSFPEYLRKYKPKYMIVFPDWFEKFATIDWATNQVVFYDADSVYKYSPFLGVRLKKNTISSRNTMYLYERMGRNETGIHHVPVVAH